MLGNALLSLLGPYNIPNVHVTARTVYTNNTISGAFRGFGAPQGHFAAEMQVNKLAEQLGMDPVELRMRNLWRNGDRLPTTAPLPAGVTVVETLTAAAEQLGWRRGADDQWRQAGQTNLAAPKRSALTSLEAAQGEQLRGVGLAVCFKNVGFSLGYPENCTAAVELYGSKEIERAVVTCVGADVGQGAHTLFQQVAAVALDLDPTQVEVQADHSELTGSSGSTSASRMSFMAGNAIKGAAEAALQEWRNEERPARAEYVFRARATTPYNRQTGESDPNVTYGYCAQAAEVVVDADTGQVTVKRLVSANDVGAAFNPVQIEGQIEGAVAQSMGWALLEQYIQKDGRAVTQHLSTYLIPTVLDVAEVIEPLILEIPDPQGPFGLRGMAEMPFVPTAPAIAAAIHAATGVWLDELPYTPERVWKALQRGK